jgi:hypothetical protein
MRRGPPRVGIEVIVPLHPTHRKAAREAAREAAWHPEAQLGHRLIPRRLQRGGRVLDAAAARRARRARAWRARHRFFAAGHCERSLQQHVLLLALLLLLVLLVVAVEHHRVASAQP